MLRGRPAQQVVVSSIDKKALRALVTAKKIDLLEFMKEVANVYPCIDRKLFLYAHLKQR